MNKIAQKTLAMLIGANLFGMKGAKMSGSKYPKSWKPQFDDVELRAIRSAPSKKAREHYVKQFRANHYKIENLLY